MHVVWQAKKPDQAASRDCHLAGFLPTATGLSIGQRSGRGCQDGARVYQRLRIALFHTAELEGAKLSGEIELDESYFGGARKGKRGRGAVSYTHLTLPTI